MKTQSLHTPSLLVLFALGFFALCPMTQAVNPPPDGGYAGFNTAEGQNALFNLSTGVGNAAIGWFSLWSNTDGSYNTALGAGTLLFNIGNQSTAEGMKNTAIGTAALLSNTVGSANTAMGSSALLSNTEGDGNTAVGEGALIQNTTSTQNTAVGRGALANTEAGGFNNAFGAFTLFSNTGIGNTAIGDHAGSALTTGNFNVCIGLNVDGVAGESNTTRIRNIGSTPIVGGTNVVIDGTGGHGDQVLGYASSSRRYKQDIKPMDRASETLFALKPVTFRAKENRHPGHVKHYGLIAEDVESVDSDLVVYNLEGKPETLRFDSINAMLLNEFLKEHRKVEKLEAALEAVGERFREQDAKIQRINEKVEMTKSTMQVADRAP
jgi:Chaperone of endosialidase